MRLQLSRKLAVGSVGRFGVAGLSLWSTAAFALTISPVLVELSPGRRIVSITVANSADHAQTFQTQTLSWGQPEGVDHYGDTDDLIVVPPIATIEAGGSQIFRVTTRAPLGAQERAYRLIFEDVTEFAAPSASPEGTSINVHINHNLPVFVIAAPGPPLPRLGPCRSPVPAFADGSGCVQLDNDGARNVLVKSLTVDGTAVHLKLKGGTRVLAGAWRQWSFEIPAHFTGSLQAKAETSAGAIDFEWHVPGR